MSNCARCGWRYPTEILHVLVGSMITKPVCGICALEMTNAIHGTRRTEFNGENAEQARRRALKWRKRHPECKPVEVQA